MITNPTTIHLPITRIKFPEIKLHTRDAHKLRGYFGNLFKEHSPILHNHYQDGRFRYRYPEVQYKVIHGVPTLVGVKEGAGLLPQLFLKIKELDIDGQAYPVQAKNIVHENVAIGFSDRLIAYQFSTLWMALNQTNYPQYKGAGALERRNMLDHILVGHILGFFRNAGLELQKHERLMAKTEVIEKATNFKDTRMIAFHGNFITNALLPDEIGLGKAVSRGFGTIFQKK